MDALSKPSPSGFGGDLRPPRLFARFATFARSLLAGSAATVADLAVLAFAVGVLSVSPKAANLPALFVGATVQFFGNRHFAFRAASGRLVRQAVLFGATEAAALALNAALYHAVVTFVPLTRAGAVFARLLTTNLVFLSFSYPLWRRVFQPEPVQATGEVR
jgi:putative flippase GtrA